MARARSIKPGFYKNEDLAECSVWARLVFPGLWMLADREGRLEDRPKRIKSELLSYDSQEIEPLLEELAEHGFLVRYRNSDGRFIQILKFATHQAPHYSEKPSVIKPPEFPESSTHDEGEELGTLPDESRNIPGVEPASRGVRNPLTPDSGLLTPDSLLLTPYEDARPAQALTLPPPPFLGEKNESDIPKRARVELASAWELPERWGNDAEALGFKPPEILRESERFRQYWVSGKGAGAKKSLRGWRQSWSNWLGKAESQRRFP